MNIDNEAFRRDAEAGYGEYVKAGKLPDIPPQFVYGDGRGGERVMLIGEAPGKDEVKQGRPFVGAAGKILNELLSRTGIARETLYITNTVKYRLARAGKKAGTLANRPVKKFEIALCRDWLRREIEELSPALIITLGGTALSGALGCADDGCGTLRDVTVGQAHGRTETITVNGLAYTLIPLYHPASLIYNPELRTAYYSDLEEVRRCVQSIL